MAKRMQCKVFVGSFGKIFVDSVGNPSSNPETAANEFLATLKDEQIVSVTPATPYGISGGFGICVVYLEDVPKKTDVAG